jgi:hypothetical protein
VPLTILGKPGVRVNVADNMESVPINEWFVEKSFSVQMQNELDLDKSTKYFTMVPLSHPTKEYSNIIERDSYVAIFADLMNKVKSLVNDNTGANLVVTGNPGTGKSCFYLYCIFQLLFGQQKEAWRSGICLIWFWC